jgi:hypothetical protein
MSAEAKDSTGQDAYRILLFAHGVSRLLVVWLRSISTAVILAVSMGDGQYANLAAILDSLVRDTDSSENMIDAPGSIEQVVYRSDSSVLPVPFRESACLRSISIGKYLGDEARLPGSEKVLAAVCRTGTNNFPASISVPCMAERNAWPWHLTFSQ